MSDFGRPSALCADAGVSINTAKNWAQKGLVRRSGVGRKTLWHVGDFADQVEVRQGISVVVFDRPLRDGECAHQECSGVRDPDSLICFCREHQDLLDGSRPASSVGRSVRCPGCQRGLPQSARDGWCGVCARRQSDPSLWRHMDSAVAA